MQQRDWYPYIFNSIVVEDDGDVDVNVMVEAQQWIPAWPSMELNLSFMAPLEQTGSPLNLKSKWVVEPDYTGKRF